MQAGKGSRRSHCSREKEPDLKVSDITEADFDAIAAQLDEPIIEISSIEVISGHHPDLGRTILIRDRTRFIILVETSAPLDLALAERQAGMGQD